MNMEMPENGKIEIELTEDDLNELQITYEELDYSNIETRRVVWTLLDLARKNFETDFDLTGRLLVEVFPSRTREGGCLLSITLNPPVKGQVKIGKKNSLTKYIYEFQSADALIGFAKQLGKLSPPEKGGELYGSGKKLRLIIGLDSGKSRLKAILNEYAEERASDDISVSFTKEHWNQIIESGALETIIIGG